MGMKPISPAFGFADSELLFYREADGVADVGTGDLSNVVARTWKPTLSKFSVPVLRRGARAARNCEPPFGSSPGMLPKRPGSCEGTVLVSFVVKMPGYRGLRPARKRTASPSSSKTNTQVLSLPGTGISSTGRSTPSQTSSGPGSIAIFVVTRPCVMV